MLINLNNIKQVRIIVYLRYVFCVYLYMSFFNIFFTNCMRF